MPDLPRILLPLVVLSTLTPTACAPTADPSDDVQEEVKAVVDAAILPLLQEHDIPGMAVAVIVGGRTHHFDYGVASRESGSPVTPETLFEVGSISKLFTATLGAWAEGRGALALSDPAARHWEALEGSPIGDATLLDLGTYAAGGLPLQFPSEVVDEATMLAYYRDWQPVHTPGSHRLYSNPSIGLFGFLAARSLGRPFTEVMEGELVPALGLSNTFIRVPAAMEERYAWGYSSRDEPVRVNPGMLDAEAYGIRSSSADMARFVEANLGTVPLDPSLAAAVATTHVGYFRVGSMTQGLGWESYPYPLELDRLLEGTSPNVILEANPLERLSPPEHPGGDRIFNKTGSTNGFGGYVAFVPDRGLGLVMLANRNYPNAARVTAGHGILHGLERVRRGEGR